MPVPAYLFAAHSSTLTAMILFVSQTQYPPVMKMIKQKHTHKTTVN